MNVLYVCCERLNKSGGTPLRVREICKQMIAQGNSVAVLSPRYDSEVPTGWPVRLLFVRLPGRSIASFAMFDACLPLVVAWWAWKLRSDCVVSTGSVSSFLVHWVLRLMGRFYCVEVNGLIDVEAPRMKLSTWASRLFSWCIRVTGLYRNADLFVCVASGIEEELLRRWPPLIGRTTTIGNGVDMDRFGAPDRELSRRSLGFADGTFVIGFVGLLCPWHGTEDLVSACHLIRKRGRQFRLIIVGGGERLESLKVQATELGLNDVTVFTGRVSPEEVPKYTACFDVACQPHNDPVVGKFGNSMKFWEYLAAGIPVIVSDMSESSRHVGLGLVGWKHRGGDPSDLANRIEYAMDHPDECKMIRAGNRAFAARGHTWSAVADSMTKAMAQRMT